MKFILFLLVFCGLCKSAQTSSIPRFTIKGQRGYGQNSIAAKETLSYGRSQFKLYKNERPSMPKSFIQLASLRGGGTTSPITATETSLHKKKRKIRRKKSDGSDGGSIIHTHEDEKNKFENVESDVDLPTVKAILLPRYLSLPQLIRLFSAFLFTSSFLESLRTSGLPYNEAVIRTLEAHGMKTHSSLLHSMSQKVTPLDEYFAEKIIQSENNLLPPKHFPSSLPLFGLVASMMINICLTMLFPRWSVQYNVWLNYQQVNAAGFDNDMTTSNNLQSQLQRIESCLQAKENIDGEDEMYDQSQFINRNRPPSGTRSNPKNPTGLAVLIQLSKQQKEMSNDGKTEDIVWLYRSESPDYDQSSSPRIADGRWSHPTPYFIEVGQRRVYVRLEVNRERGSMAITCADGGPTFYLEEEVSKLISRGSEGLSNRREFEYAMGRYSSYNDFNLSIPTVYDAFIARISSPLAVLQLTGRILTALEESFAPAFMNIFMTLVQHYMNAKKGIVSAKELSNEIRGNVEDAKEQIFWTLRPKNFSGSSKKKKKSILNRKKKWQRIPSSQLLPGDVFFLPSGDTIMPVDAILLEGTCIAQEAAITGESVPQSKIAIEPDCTSMESHDRLSINTKHRNSVLFGGTAVIGCKKMSENMNATKLPDSSSSVKCLALKTGSYSSKGEIVRALSKSSGHAGRISTVKSDRDSLRLIIALSFFATLACASLFVPHDDCGFKKTSGFRRAIQCTRIIVASIPSDLPLALNHVVQSCAIALRKDADVVCSEQGSLLTAAQVDMVVFDKTGTLTSDTQSMTGVMNPIVRSQHPMAEVVLAGCHSLSSINDSSSRLIGDPLDLASVEYSRWVFNSTDKTAYAKQSTVYGNSDIAEIIAEDTRSCKKPKKLWQIKSFPFDPARRRSSALALVQHEGGGFKLWKVVKGSPDAMKFMLCADTSLPEEVDFLSIYDKAVEDLGLKGTRLVTMAVQDVTDSSLFKILFPLGLPKSTDPSSKEELEKIHKCVASAKKTAKSKLHIGDFESSVQGSMTFVGFACFNVLIRPSTPRVIKDIRDSGTNVCMLTGDDSSAALSVAKQSNFFDKKCKKVAVLDVVSAQLKWKILRMKNGNVVNSSEFSIKKTTEIISKKVIGLYAIMVSGNAIEVLLQPSAKDKVAANQMLCNLDNVALISRASPQTKQQVVSVLKSQCGKSVMMCGDGVNDISAMKTADISAALLNGYGKEEAEIDVENERRKARLKYKKIGRNKDAADFGTEGHIRIKKKLEEAIQDDSIGAVWKILKEEYKRGKELQKGGATAARILQAEENLRKSMVTKATVEQKEGQSNVQIEESGTSSIQAGESSLAAAFTFLRPTIDGADAIIRYGVAAAAFSISSHRSIALDCLMACYNLASLYRDGFRYGKYMWNVELAFILAMDRGLGDISSMPRARIPRLRPHDSIFHPAVALSVLLQAIVHLFVLNKGVRGATFMQIQSHDQSNGLKIRFAQSTLKGMQVYSTEELSEGGGVLGRMPFRPNLVTNVVFILSIYQNAIISSVNHSGLPYHGSLLESRSFCIWATLSVLFCVMMVLEIEPSVNNVLQLAPMPSKKFQIFMIALFLIDVIGSILADFLCVYFLDNKVWLEANRNESEGASEYSADIEENMLRRERKRNLSFIGKVLAASALLASRLTLATKI